MSKIRTISDLGERLDKEIAWRKKELITIKLEHDKARSHQASMLRRAGVALLYAHWEGFIKAAGTFYIEFVSLQGLRYQDLQPNFAAIGAKGQLLQMQDSVRGRKLVELANFFMRRLSEQAALPWKGAVQTKFNLSSERLRDIIAVLGLDFVPFELREKTVIDSLLHHRNHIAHGQFLEVDTADFSMLHREILGMIDEFHTQIENAAKTHRFKA